MTQLSAPAEVLALAGPTAGGKTAAALALARAWRARGVEVEIVSVDSALVYRGMDIGTAKPTAAERAEFRHHLIDLIEPEQAYSAAEFVADATRCVEDITARGALPLLVGGTMLYFKALFDGMDALPAADAAVRAELDEAARQRGWPALHEELAQVDPVTAARLAPRDAQRIQRALEVWRVSGRPLSSFHSGRFEREAAAPTVAGRPCRLLSLEPDSREWLHRRIADRFRQMLAEGLLDEVRRLMQRGSLSADLPSMRCVGYRQAWEVLAGQAPAGGLAERGIAATRQLAKRQLTWLRGMPQRERLRADDPQLLATLLALAGPEACPRTGD
ncbi:MAG: tRNA (adenosine(37)-N6)-dimethylallyltransferase MiaA [Burkholderiales bacterium]|jgi:tRNA dimethylallyltransferase|nr:tRNA (adenosine(37)-N6)-dimethylallyltransferase MiaA [Burkholderiales bacterium]MBP7520073.1 tRNA (adenosine(37)-N6)-dimethylallyltransferase MiaA [Leptothrix sp. (in: b-proteobacteria)]HQY08943.1 tRNA (adenosine(37)-N6)-dimethylallyltransferase MiaA [Burkholderiaceae bacterium]